VVRRFWQSYRSGASSSSEASPWVSFGALDQVATRSSKTEVDAYYFAVSDLFPHALLEDLDVAGHIVTLDAMHCHADSSSQRIENLRVSEGVKNLLR
jgi:hypothetical protein